MRDHSSTPWLNWIAYSSIAAIGVATALFGVTIFGVSAYRNIVSSESKVPEPNTPQTPEPDSFSNNNLVCFQANESITTSNISATGALPNASPAQELLALESTALERKISSFGQRTLVREEALILQQVENRDQKIEKFRAAKQQGIKDYTNGQYQAAVSRFTAARGIHKNSPENLIYLNNALASQASKSYGLAVIVPLNGGQNSSNSKVAMDILRGVAHAQDDINKAGGIQGVPLKLLIVDDFDNSPQSAEAVAQMLVKKQNILGVVGHNDSKATLAARRIYENSGITSISPTSTSADLPPGHTFAFRTVPNDLVAVEKIAEHLRDKNHRKIAVFYEADNAEDMTGYGQPVKEAFEAFLTTNIDGGEIVKEFNLAHLESDQGESLIKSLEQLITASEIDTVMLMPSNSDASVLKALEVAVMSRNLSERILMIGNAAMYDSRIANCGDQVADLVAVSFWDMNFARTSISSMPSKFARKASSGPEQAGSLWETDTNWLSAMAYDAVLAFGEGLEDNHPSPNRTNIAASLSDKIFSLDGATGIVKFDNSGDRIGKARLVQVLPSDETNLDNVQYEFQSIFSAY